MNFNGFNCPMCRTSIRTIGYHGKIHYKCRNCEYYCISGKVVGELELMDAIYSLTSSIINISNQLMILEPTTPALVDQITRELAKLGIYLDDN